MIVRVALCALFVALAQSALAQEHAAPTAAAPTRRPAASPAPAPAAAPARPAAPPAAAPVASGDPLVSAAQRIRSRIAALEASQPSTPAASAPAARRGSSSAGRARPPEAAERISLTWRATVLWPAASDGEAPPADEAPARVRLVWPEPGF